MSAAPAISPAYETRWTVLSGPMRGTVRVMQNAQFHLGRSPECEFPIVNDPKCSRRHAMFEWTRDGCYLTSLSESNPVQINGRDVEKALVRDGDMVMLGETQIQFNLGNLPAKSAGGELELVQDEPIAPAPARPSMQQPPPNYGPRPSSGPRRPPKKQAGVGRFVIYGLILAVGYWLFSSSPKKAEEAKIRTQAQIEADIADAQKAREAAEIAATQRLDATMTAKQAQENYVRGFRDYRDGQYERSLNSFQACLALSPEHTLCNRYLRLAQRKFQELVQSHVILGRKYREQNQFKACRASFRNVMFMVKDPGSTIYKEAKANYEVCNALVEGKY